jgi:sortase (surface protein transpeptidase)
LTVTARRFRTSKANRAKTFKQLVIPVYGLAIREIAVRQQQRRSRRQFIKLAGIRLRKQTLVPAVCVVLGLAGIGFFGWQAITANKLETVKTFSSTAAAQAKPKTSTNKPKGLPRSEPTHLTVPAVGIDANIVSVGLNPDGSLETPPVLDWVTGWYRGSPTPGEIGPSVINGHVDNYKGISVFWRLRELKANDVIEVTRTDGKVVKFKVDALKQFDQAAFPTQEVYGNIDYPGLRLITCGGAFDHTTGHYLQNTVVYASIITS